MTQEDLDAITSKRICCHCVGESFLQALIDGEGVAAECKYCGDDTGNTWSIGMLADRVEEAFDAHMVRTSTEPPESERALYADPELGRDWYRRGVETAEAIEFEAAIPFDAANDVQAILEDRYDDIELGRMGLETEFSGNACYEEKPTDANDWHRAWSTFENSLKTKARFFNSSGADLLDRVFGRIDRLRTKPRHPLVVAAGPGHRINHLFRARVFQSDSKLEEAIGRPDLHLGAPPARLSNAGRMNAKGVSVFYGATNASVALAEVRPPVGSKVVVGKFSIIRQLRLLDLTALDRVRDGGSIFDPTLKERLERAAFLQTLGDRLTRPVMPDDEDFDYLITQAIADFLATQNEPRLDGIVFASAQTKIGRNVVLFHEAALVEQIDLPQGTKINSSRLDFDEDGSRTDYLVWEEVPPQPEPEKESDLFVYSAWMHSSIPDDTRVATLQVDPTSVEIHHIESVQVRSTAFPVQRKRITV